MRCIYSRTNIEFTILNVFISADTYFWNAFKQAHPNEKPSSTCEKMSFELQFLKFWAKNAYAF